MASEASLKVRDMMRLSVFDGRNHPMSSLVVHCTSCSTPVRMRDCRFDKLSSRKLIFLSPSSVLAKSAD